MSNLLTSSIGFPFPNPLGFKEGARGYPLGSGPGGGDGIVFATGAELFTWQTISVPGNRKPTMIISFWVDASGLTAGKNLLIKTPYQTFIFAGGNQGYVVCTVPAPCQISISTNGGTGTVFVIAYNFNAAFAGAPGGTLPAGATSVSGGASGSGGGGGSSGFAETGGSGGGRPTL